jgi:purine-binding chemotaxis protein CheW
MLSSSKFIAFTLDSTRIAFALDDIDRVIRAVAVTPVPGASPCVMGVINIHGTVTPLFDTRALLGLPSRPLRPSDHIMITRSPSRPRAFIADEVLGSFECDDLAAPESYLIGTSKVKGVARREDGMVLVHDLKQLMALDDAMPIQIHG